LALDATPADRPPHEPAFLARTSPNRHTRDSLFVPPAPPLRASASLRETRLPGRDQGPAVRPQHPPRRPLPL